VLLNGRYAAWAGLVFIASIFYGDLWIGLTIPTCVLLMPLLATVGPARFRTLPPGFFVLAGLVLVVAVQAATGGSPRGKQDFVVYLPVLYAGAAMIALRNVSLAPRLLRNALIAGGAVTAFAMLFVALLLPAGTTVIPGQTLYAPEPRHTEQVDHAQTTESRPSNGPEEAVETEFYTAKSMYRNALGVSNYIAAFLVFVGTVCLFSGALPLAGLFGLVAVVTLSRFAMVYIVIAAMAWMVRRRFGAAAALLFIALASAAGVALIASIHDWPHVPASLGVRFSYWLSGLEAIRSEPLIGQPRSYIVSLQHTTALWNPHNMVLSYGAYFGIIGLLIYVAYLCVALSAIWRRARQSDVWMGILFGLAIMLGWGSFEVVAFTPAFEILMASLYVLALNDLRFDARPGVQGHAAPYSGQAQAAPPHERIGPRVRAQ
jgi:hypothetical protein